MGNAVSAAEQAAAEKQKEVEQMITALENKLEAFQFEVDSTRGLNAEDKGEVVGGRTVMRVSDIRVASGSDISKNIAGAVTDFFQAASNDVDGDSKGAKRSAVKGAEKLVIGALGALFGTGSGKGTSKKSFVVLFLNNAFIRVDYFVYTYAASGQKWGAEASTSGACYLADLAVLDLKQLEPAEIDFLLSQALRVGPDEFDKLNRLKFALIQSAILGRALSNADGSIDFNDLGRIAEELAKSNEEIDLAFGALEDFTFEENANDGLAPSPPTAPMILALPEPPINDDSLCKL